MTDPASDDVVPDDPDQSAGPEGHAPSSDALHDTAHDPRLRTVGVVLGVGFGLSVVLAFGAGLLGASGAVSAVVLLVLLGTTFAVASLLALGTAVVDEYRGRPVGRARIVVGVVSFVATIAVMAMAGAAG